MRDPIVSVIMPAYNAEAYIAESVRSVLAQTLVDFECLVMEDGSSDKTLEILRSFDDPRVKVFSSETNLGYTEQLRKGLANAKGKYIARLDADDRCRSDRFEKQVSQFESIPDLVLLGSCCRLIDEKGVVIGHKKHPISESEIRWRLLLDNPFQHPSVMILTETLKKYNLGYSVEYEPSEDYHLWCALAEVGRVQNLSDELIDYRIHSGQVSSARREKQLEFHDKIVRQNLKTIDGSWNDDLILRASLRYFEQGHLFEEDPELQRTVVIKYLELWEKSDQGRSREVMRHVMHRLKRIWSKSKNRRTKKLILSEILKTGLPGMVAFCRS